MKFKLIWRYSFIASFLTLICVFALADTPRFLWRTLFFGIGILLVLTGVGLSMLAKLPHRQLIYSAALLAAYVMLFGLQFQVQTFGDYIPEGQTIEEIEVRLGNTSERITWRPQKGSVVFAEQEGGVVVSGGNENEVVEKIRELTLRNYWWPGAVQSDLITDLSIQFTDESSVSVYRENNGVVVFLHENDRTSISSWMIYGDLANLLPSKVLSLIKVEDTVNRAG